MQHQANLNNFMHTFHECTFLFAQKFLFFFSLNLFLLARNLSLNLLFISTKVSQLAQTAK